MASLLEPSDPKADVAVPHLMSNSIVARCSHGLTERSVFHEPWWLDITTGSRWGLAVVENGNEVIAEMPYMLHRKGPWLLSTQPPLTRTLGPIIKAPKMSSYQDRRYSLNVTAELISKLPRCALFQQTFDIRIGEVAAFSACNFSVSTSFTFTIPPERDEQDVWGNMRANTRNVIRRAEERVMVAEIVSADEFVDFYDANLANRKRHNVYGSRLMRRLIDEAMRRKAAMALGTQRRDHPRLGQLDVVLSAIHPLRRGPVRMRRASDLAGDEARPRTQPNFRLRWYSEQPGTYLS
jgi:hypothetical protein